MGAVLQALSTNRIIFNTKDVQSDLIDYRLGIIEFYRKPFNLRRPFKQKGIGKILKGIISEFYFLPRRYKAYKKTNAFVKKHLTTSSKFTKKSDLNVLNHEYDGFVVGSDMVWNPLMSENLDGFYFAKFASPDKIVFLYAASVGQEKVEEEVLRRIIKNTSHFKNVSLRERTTANQLQALTNRHIYYCIDPTLLTKMSDWEKYTDKFKYRNESYIFVFMLEPNKDMVTLVEKIAHERNLKIYTYNFKRRFHSKNVKSVPPMGPGEFLDAINKAQVIVTNSFHGCAFSILFNKDFYALPHSTRSLRITDLLESLSLMNRFVTDVASVDFSQKIDYEKVNEKLDKIRQESYDYINKSLGIRVNEK